MDTSITTTSMYVVRVLQYRSSIHTPSTAVVLLCTVSLRTQLYTRTSSSVYTRYRIAAYEFVDR